jgi:hypothetical protein
VWRTSETEHQAAADRVVPGEPARAADRLLDVIAPLFKSNTPCSPYALPNWHAPNFRTREALGGGVGREAVMQQAETEPRICGMCSGRLRRVRQVPLKSFEGQRIFECVDCGQLTMLRPQHPAAAHPPETRGAGVLNLL